MTRQVLLHYHLFKNAGSSVDRMLRESYGPAWVNYDTDEPAARISPLEMQALIEDNPEIKAFSSHQVIPPLPAGDFEVFPIVFLRNPIERIRSAWLFEWKKQLDLDEPKGSLSDYIQEKLIPLRGSVIANFQVFRLSNTKYGDISVKTTQHEVEQLEAAVSFLRSISFFGLVERYDESIALLASQAAAHFPDLSYPIYQENITQDSSVAAAVKLEQIKAEIGDALFDEILLRNRLDLQLYSYAQGLFDARLEIAGLSGEPDESAVKQSLPSVASM